jgi:tetratricopeptide (TPR) repeat protein
MSRRSGGAVGIGRALRLAGAVAIAVPALPAAGQSEIAELHAQAVAAAVEHPLPPLGEVLRGAVPVARPLLVLADFNEDLGDCRARALGEAVGVALRVEAWGLSPGLSFSHPTGYWADGWAVSGPNRAGRAARVAARSGAGLILHGTIAEVATGFQLDYRLVDSRSQQVVRAFSRDSAADALAATLADVIRDVLQERGAAIAAAEQERLERAAGRTDALLRFAVAQRNNCEGADYADEISLAWNDAPDYPPLAALYVQDAASRFHRGAAGAHIDNVLGAAGWHPVVRLAGSYAAVYEARANRNPAAVEALRELASRYPHEPAAIFALSDVLAAEELIYEYPDTLTGQVGWRGTPVPHPPSYAAGIALAARAVTLWPDHYRAWWCLAYVLGHYSSAIRGGDYWQKVPESARRRIPKIGVEIDYALGRAIESHPVQSRLHLLQIENDTNVPRDWMPTFWKAVALVPHDAGIYRVAFNYSQEQWGGSARQRFAVYRAAVERNPGARWPDELYRGHAPWWESYPATLVVAYWRRGLVVLVLLTLVGWIARRLLPRA